MIKPDAGSWVHAIFGSTRLKRLRLAAKPMMAWISDDADGFMKSLPRWNISNFVAGVLGQSIGRVAQRIGV